MVPVEAPRRFADRSQRRQRPSTGVREEDVDTAFLLVHRRVQPVKIGEVGHIALHPGDMAADPLHGGIKCGLTPASDEDIGPFCDESLCGGEPDATGASGDDSNFSCELSHDVLLRGQRTPPWTRSVSPVIQPESLDARNTATIAISDG